jgi:hypothetical protein
MTQNEKDLLIKDLCARLPYGVKVEYENKIFDVEYVCPMYEEVKLDIPETWTINIDEVKPYLFPISSISEDQKYDFYCRFIKNDCNFNDFKFYLYTGMWRRKLLTLTSIDDIEAIIDWFHKNHIDYCDLIPMGLANDATSKNIY